jgi:hypothetical protein
MVPSSIRFGAALGRGKPAVMANLPSLPSLAALAALNGLLARSNSRALIAR